MARKIIVSNRLPFSFKKVDGKLTYQQGGGGLATALSSYTKGGNSLWIGWPGLPSDDLSEDDKTEITEILKKHNCHPVFLSQKQIDEFYNGYSNSVLWPVYHDMDVVTGNTDANWKAFVAANKLYAETAVALSSPKDTLWIHDYQLQLVPEQIRVLRPRSRVGFFLHIPFPKHAELVKSGHADKLLRGVLGADLVGFHTPSYVENFLAGCVAEKIGRVGTEKVALSTRIVRVTEFPISIDYEAFEKATKTRDVAREYKNLQWRYKGKKVILMSDRMDPAKGLLERLKAYQTLLKKQPELHGKVVMAMIAMPSRGDIEVYKKLREDIERLVIDINEQFGTKSWRPIDAVYDNLPFAKYAALYRRADVAFIAPLRDGMNLVAKEFLASATKHDGVLVLSETAGAAEELKDAILVNPNRPKTLVSGLHDALTLPKSELRRRTANMQRHIKHFNVHRWVDSFVDTLEKPRQAPGLVHVTHTLSRTLQNALLADYHQTKKRLIMLDYDGTLQPFVNDPAKSTPSRRVLNLLKRLSDDPANDVVVTSGRSRSDLQSWFGGLPVGLAAEHGAFYRRKGGQNWHRTVSGDMNWQEYVAHLFAHYAEMTPGAHVEHKEYALVWHYRGASPYHSQKNLVALRRLLRPIAKKYNLVVRDGQKILEVKPREAHKGRIGQEWLIHDHDFVLCAGDDTTDEDMFEAMPPESWSIKIGRGRSLANYRLANIEALHTLLRKL